MVGAEGIVEVVDTACTSADLPEDLFAVPSWYLNGRRVSLGNPTFDELLALVGLEPENR
jgi:hypothetical protein